MRIVVLGGVCALAFFAMGAAAQQPVAGMGGAPSGGVVETKPNSVPLRAAKPDSARRPARAAECAEKVAARRLRGKVRRHALRECGRGS